MRRNLKDSLTAAYRKHGRLIKENLKKRIELYSLMDRDGEVARAEKALALKDWRRFFAMHAWTHDPRPHILRMYGLSKPCLPFLLFGFQDKAIEAVINSIHMGEDVLFEKSRDMGVTWFLVIVILWFWLQESGGNDFLLGSRKEEYVDRKGNLDTLFEKMRYVLYRLHPVFLPRDFDGRLCDTYMGLRNPETGSFIRGESNNPNFGTSGRYRAVLMDEFAKWEETDEQAWTSTADTCGCRISVSTPWGIGRKFAQLRYSGAIKVLTFHWTEHPIKSAGKFMGQHPYISEKGQVWLSPWYLAECERRKDDPLANIGQELDIDYLSSGSPYFNNVKMNQRFGELAQRPFDGKRFSFERVGDSVRLIENAGGSVWIRKKCDHIKKWVDYRYCLAGDTAEGLEKGDFDAAYIYDRVMGEDVAWIHGRMDTDVYAILLVHLAKMYDNAYIGVENNNHGHAVLKKIVGLGYMKLMHEKDFTVVPNWDRVKIGWSTNAVTRPVMCSDLREIVNVKDDGIYDKEFFNEALTFVYNKNGKAEADAGCYDDRVMSQAIKFQLHMWLPSPKKAELKIFPKDHMKKKKAVFEGERFV